MKKVIVLASGGIDSTTCIGMSVKEYGKDNVISVSMFYGQKHKKELEQARKVADYYDVEHRILSIADILKDSNCPLMSGSTEDVPMMSYDEQVKKNGKGKVSTYVPFRNGLMLSAAAALAQSLYPEDECVIYIGAHADDASEENYADCSVEFMESMNKAINIGTYNKVNITRPFINMTKSEIIKLGLELDVPYELTYSCYNGFDTPCGTCGTCIERREAFESNGVTDPAL